MVLTDKDISENMFRVEPDSDMHFYLDQSFITNPVVFGCVEFSLEETEPLRKIALESLKHIISDNAERFTFDIPPDESIMFSYSIGANDFTHTNMDTVIEIRAFEPYSFSEILSWCIDLTVEAQKAVFRQLNASLEEHKMSIRKLLDTADSLRYTNNRHFYAEFA